MASPSWGLWCVGFIGQKDTRQPRALQASEGLVCGLVALSVGQCPSLNLPLTLLLSQCVDVTQFGGEPKGAYGAVLVDT